MEVMCVAVKSDSKEMLVNNVMMWTNVKLGVIFVLRIRYVVIPMEVIHADVLMGTMVTVSNVQIRDPRTAWYRSSFWLCCGAVGFFRLKRP